MKQSVSKNGFYMRLAKSQLADLQLSFELSACSYLRYWYCLRIDLVHDMFTQKRTEWNNLTVNWLREEDKKRERDQKKKENREMIQSNKGQGWLHLWVWSMYNQKHWLKVCSFV